MPVDQDDRDKIWKLIKGAHSALLITVGADGLLDSRPMGCLQNQFEDTLWFLTFWGSPKVQEIAADRRVLVSYANPSKYEYVSLIGNAQVIDDRHKIHELWSQGLRVWFPKGPDDPSIALLAIKIEEAKYWTNAASIATYAWAYVRARLTGKSPPPEEIAEIKTVRL
jgi:general stress protein 26